MLFVAAHFLSPHRRIMRELMNSMDLRERKKSPRLLSVRLYPPLVPPLTLKRAHIERGI